MRAIKSYPLTGIRAQAVEMPAEATILSVCVQTVANMPQPCLTALVNTNNENAKRGIYLVAEGEDASELFESRYCRFIGLVQIHGVTIHVFEDAGEAR